MKNVIFFVVLAILTVAALVGWNAVRKQSPSQVAVVTPTSNPTPTIEIGGAVGRTVNGLSDIVNTNNPMASGAAVGSGDTKGGVSLSTPVPTAATTLQPTAKITPQPTVNIPQVNNVVNLADNGFNNKTITVKSGTMVKFVNSSSKRMWIQSASVNGGQSLSGFDMGVSVGKDGSYEYQFNQTGTWGYQNKENTNQQGSIIVN